MPTVFDVFKKDSTREIIVREDGGATPAGFTAFGTFTDTDNDAELPFHYVRDLLFNAGELDPSSWSIKRLATAVDVSPATTTLDLSDGETVQLGVSFTPAQIASPACTYVSSDPTKATVSATGLVTPVAAGATTITVTNTASGKTDTCVVTVQA
jgi:hypothetical protein